MNKNLAKLSCLSVYPQFLALGLQQIIVGEINGVYRIDDTQKRDDIKKKDDT